MSPAQQQARVKQRPWNEYRWRGERHRGAVGGAMSGGEIEVGGQAGLSVGLCMLSDDRQECISRCPEGQTCDAECSRCVPIQQIFCSINENGACLDECPDNLVCNVDCRECVVPAGEGCAMDDVGQCNDRCALGTQCDPNCQGCVPSPPACSGRDECNGLDDDCDNRIDEDANIQLTSCGSFAGWWNSRMCQRAIR